ncbi:low-complexity tail membrane protein [Pantanalinema rosaneae CENA516]|uniref:low-complexity tail membrane protein n=1 Tax=Pantanalinema rosaneae TaxID=1620701 RepID=UPI003D6F8F2B
MTLYTEHGFRRVIEAMRSFWSDPYLWIHLAGLATVPIWIELCWLGLAIGDPVLPPWLELLLIGVIGVAPIFWMQWQRPFSIFSLLILAVKPDALTEDQRRLLTLFKSPRTRIFSVLVAFGLLTLLRQLYYTAPIAATAVPAFLPESRWVGLAMAAIGFFGANLFVQVPASVVGVLLTSNAAFLATPPCPVEQVRQGFTSVGLRLKKIPLVPVPAPVSVATASVGDSTPNSVTTSPELTTTEVVAEESSELE